MKRFYWYRGEMIESLEYGGYIWTDETCRGNFKSPIYKTIEDARNAIRKYLDGTQKSEPRIIGQYIWTMEKRDWTPHYFNKEQK